MVNFLSNTMEAKGSVKYFKKTAGEKDTIILYRVKIPIRYEEKLITVTHEKNHKEFQQSTYPKIVAKSKFCENKGNDKEES